MSHASVEFLLAVWLFALGGAVGSFLNVVVYRLPRRMSLIAPGSHCPACKHPIRWHDNLPILAWFLLRGRCRDCGARISGRYPLVEAVTAMLFLAVGAMEGFSFGANLPQRPILVPDGVLFRPMSLAEVAGTVAYHLLLLSTLLAAAIVEYDGLRLPVRVMLPALAVGWLAPLAWPQLHPVPAFAGLAPPWAGLVDGTAGLALGLALGGVTQLAFSPRDRLGLLLGPGCAGLFLGWQAVAAVGLAVCVIHGMSQMVGRRWPILRRISPGLWLLAGTLGYVLAWTTVAGTP
jgi:leader peptidase (prepilin peptidase)/N-methyltransferase